MSVNFFCTDFYTLFLLRNTMGAFINYVDVFLDLFVPLFPLYRIEVALINRIAHGATEVGVVGVREILMAANVKNVRMDITVPMISDSL